MRIAIMGPAGKMGRLVIKEALGRRRDFMIVGGVVPHDNPNVRQDLGKALGEGFVGATTYDELEYCIPIAQGVIDFSVPEATMETVKKCVEYRRPLVIAATGIGEDDLARIKYASGKTPILFAVENMDELEEMVKKTPEEQRKTGGEAEARRALNALLAMREMKLAPGLYTYADVEI